MKAISINQLFEDFITLIFPNICSSCKRTLIYGEEVLCTHCRWSLPETNYHNIDFNPLIQKFAFEPKVKFVHSFLHYNAGGIAQKLIHALKYKNAPQIGNTLALWYGEKLIEQSLAADFLIPVPIHKKRLIERGYNQSEIIAQGLSLKLKIPVQSTWLKRSVYTRTQTRKKKIDRWKNMSNVFYLDKAHEFAGASVILVDDVLTTGATLGMIIEVLVSAQVKSIGIIVLAAGK